jgi:lipopolysaccharide/colanic/teichoic acid biosynthesis glycosyltransferase
MYGQVGKRVFDIICGLSGFLVFSPVMLICAIVVATSLGRPVLFRQSRAGLGGHSFIMTKFRTMHDFRDETGQLLPDALRVSRLGSFLRRVRLDELPEFLQIISGELSMVGPRPLPARLLEEQGVLLARGAVRPGMTGLAQVSGNTLLSLHEKLAIDLYYAARPTFFGDLKILFQTFITVIRGERRNEDIIRRAERHA